MKLVLLSIAASSFFGATLTSPIVPKVEPKADPISFKEKVAPLLKKYCINCHGPDKVEKGLRVDTYDNLMKGTRYGKIVIAGKSADSVLVKAIKKVPGASAMPPSRRKMTDAEIKLISDWVNEGAKNN